MSLDPSLAQLRLNIADVFVDHTLLATLADISTRNDPTGDASYFTGKHWAQLEATDWQDYSDAIYEFTPNAFLYYLPGVLIVSIDGRNPSLTAADSIVTSLDTSGDPDIWTSWFSDRFGRLTPIELQVIADWLGFYLFEQEEIQRSELARGVDTITMLKLLVEQQSLATHAGS